jgi:hypothetical protein
VVSSSIQAYGHHVKLLLTASILIGCGGSPIANPSNRSAASAGVPGRDLVGWATRIDDKLHLELVDRSVFDAQDRSYDCKMGRPPYSHYVIEIVGGSDEGTRYPATMAQSCPASGPCTPISTAALLLETHIAETDGGAGVLELTFADGRAERNSVEYDYCYR